MSFSSILGTFFLGPLKLIFEAVFQTGYQLTTDPGFSIVCLSLVMNFLVLPLYRRADAMQEQARDTEEKLRPGVTHIRRTFSGNERMMMLQTYYRQNNYSPVKALRSSVSLLLEIPFFMAAYQFLSKLELLRGASFGPIRDLSVPDGLIRIGGTAFHLLPILMTLLNFASAALYLKGFPLKTKIRTYGIAVVFLVLLYTSPSGLVLYWSFNNLFSLLKNVWLKLVKGKVRKKARVRAFSGRRSFKPRREWIPDRKLFLAAALFLTVFVGALIPANYIAASPQEYVDPSFWFSPLWFVLSSLLYAAGSFLLWTGVFYWLANAKGKVIMERILWALCGVAVVSYMFFGTRFGMVSSALRYEGGMSFVFLEGLFNFLICLAAAAALLFLLEKFRKHVRYVLLIAALASSVMTVIHVVKTKQSLAEVRVVEENEQPHFSFSREGRNVAVLFLDRMMGGYIPYLLQEKPELKEIYDGFTWYSDVISYGGHTNIAAPALLGGYEYTPVELNRRSSEYLKKKHNESLLVLPVLFDQNGYDVTVCDAPYANYKWIPDLSIYDDYPGIDAYITRGHFGKIEDKSQAVQRNMRNFFCFSLTKSMPILLQYYFYDGGNYLMAGAQTGVFQIRNGISSSTGVSQTFMEPYLVLENLKEMTRIEETGNHALFFYNDAPHEPMMLKEPEYVPAVNVDNREYDETHSARFTADGKRLIVKSESQMIHYQTDMAALLRVGEWLAYLKEAGVYDNTRIIIVSDHGFRLGQMEELLYTEKGVDVDLGTYYPLLMVKDFGSHGFTVSDEFMTNADTAFLSVKDVIGDPVNPFTGRLITNTEKTAHPQCISLSTDWSVVSNSGRTLNASQWLLVTDSLRNRAGQEIIEKRTVLKEHQAP